MDADVYLHVLFRLLSGSLSVPVLKVLVYSSLLCLLVLSHHSHEADGLLGGLSVHCLLEGGITLMVFLLELHLVDGHCLCVGVWGERIDLVRGDVERR